MLFNKVYIKMFYKYKKCKKIYRLFKVLYSFKEFPFFKKKEFTGILK